MPEVVIGNLLGMKLVHTNIDVEVGLNIVAHFACLFEFLSCTAQTVRERFVTLRNPASLYPSRFFSVTFLLFVLAEESCDRLDGLLRIDLPEMPRRLPSLHELGDSSGPKRFVLASYASLVL